MPRDYNPGAFRCGEDEIDGYLHDGNAWADEERWLARTYVVESGVECAGYFTLMADAIRLNLSEAAETDSPYQAAPAVKLARIGACRRFKSLGLGDLIFDLVLTVARQIAKDIGVRYITVDALPRDWLIERYKKLGFVSTTGKNNTVRPRSRPRHQTQIGR